ncbi:MAG: Ig-like domain repeat protein [Terriglobales bacterium]
MSTHSSRTFGFLASLIACLFVIASPLWAQSAPLLVTHAVDNSVRTVLTGTVHPLARAEFDRGEAPSNLVLHRMLLVLQRSPQQETALRGLIDDQQDKHSANYHRWRTPEELGANFGPADSDIAAVTNWLTASGFQVAQVSKGRTIIEFSGTAGLVKQAFGTAIHKYAVNGGAYWANAGNPSIPTALTPVVKGFASLNNFPRQSHHTVVAPFNGDYPKNALLPLFTFPYNGGTLYGVGPADFATIYNVQPLWNAGIDGTGQTIAIVGETNINIQDIRDFRSLFGLPANDPQIMLNGPDPGILTDGEEVESVLDVSWSGAVAKNATVDFVVSETTETTQGIDLSAIYIIDQNLAPVMSESYGYCEAFLGSYNAFYYYLWEQAAVQGITVLLSAGDGGSAGCDNFNTASASQYGLAVSGYASTPFNVAVGGTDFDQTPATASTYWNATNNATTGESAKSYIRETPWNESCAGIKFGLNGCTPANSGYFDIVAGSGGPSSCSLQDASGNCIGGYDKPAWQTGTGVPTDGVRDTPDVSLFASDQFNGSFYILCEADIVSPCSLNPVSFLGVGGTSAASPAFAGIMALVNQKTGARQGNANYILYKLAAGTGNSCNSSTVALTGNSCLFYDITKGNNSVPCAAGSPNCGPAPSGGLGVLVDSHGNPAWTTTTGYDMATGLGSVNAANLVNGWSTATFAASTTTLTTLTPVTITHGTKVTFSATVAAKSGGGTPTGDVALMGSPGGKPLGIDFATLSGGVASGTTYLLPGGSYNVTAHYEGDETFGGSDSSGIAVNVSPENSSVYMPGVVNGVDVNGNPTYTNSVVYGTGASYQYLLRADVYNSVPAPCTTPAFGEVACPTGTITVTDNGSPLEGGTGTFKLNSFGYTEDQAIQLTVAGSPHTLVAKYNGDTSYNASPTTTATVTVTQATTSIGNVSAPSSAVAGAQFAVTAAVTTSSFGAAPTGTIQFFANGTLLTGTQQVTATTGNINAGILASLSASQTTSISPAGTYNITATYSGDTNYTAVAAGQSNSAPITITTPGSFTIGSITAVTISAPGQSGSAQVTLTPSGGFTGQVSIACTLPASMLEATCPTATGNITGTTPVTVAVAINTTGPHQVAAIRPAGTSLFAFGLLAGVFVFAIPGLRRSKMPLALLLFGVVAFIVSCGGGSSGHTDPGTPAGTYTVNINATGGGVSAPASFSVTVQ